MSRNFQILKTNYPELYSIAESAESLYINQDPNASLGKIRLFAEKILDEAAKNRGIQRRNNENQYLFIQRCSNKGLFNQSIRNLFEKIRQVGNRAAHSHTGSMCQALQQLENAYKLTKWFYPLVTGNQNNIFLPFQDPNSVPNTNPNPNTNINLRKIIINFLFKLGFIGSGLIVIFLVVLIIPKIPFLSRQAPTSVQPLPTLIRAKIIDYKKVGENVILTINSSEKIYKVQFPYSLVNKIYCFYPLAEIKGKKITLKNVTEENSLILIEASEQISCY